MRIFLLLTFLFTCFALSAQEVCDNGIDDDGDGKIDLLDEDCRSHVYPLINNPSFEKTVSCPVSVPWIQSARGWQQAQSPLILPGRPDWGASLHHPCIPPPNNDFLEDRIPRPVPDGEAVGGFDDYLLSNGTVKMYGGTCLDGTLEKDSLYVIDFYAAILKDIRSNIPYLSKSPVQLSIFGHPSCSAMPYGVNNDSAWRICPTRVNEGWVELAQITVTGAPGTWVRTRTEFSAPQDIRAFVIGPSCAESSRVDPMQMENWYHYPVDQLLLYKKDPYDLPYITRSGDACSDTLTLSANIAPLPPSATYQWYRNEAALPGSTGPALLVTNTLHGAGNYRVRITIDGRTYLSPETIVTIDEAKFSLPDSLFFCDNTPQVIGPQFSQASASQFTLRWQDGSTDSLLSVSAPGIYWLEVDKNSCKKRDSTVAILLPPPAINLGADTTICGNAPYLLQPGNADLTYRWQDNSTADSYRVTHSGLYTVTAFDGRCYATDSVRVRFEQLPQVIFPGDSILCEGGQKWLNPLVHGDRFLWNTGSTDREITVSQPGTYTLQAQNGCGVATGSLHVVKGDCQFYVPSAFTPNGDGRNDRFGLAQHGFIKKYDLKIFNRWGEVVYHTTNPAFGWDGSLKGKEVPTGVYVWMIFYTDETGTEHKRQGTVTLIR